MLDMQCTARQKADIMTAAFFDPLPEQGGHCVANGDGGAETRRRRTTMDEVKIWALGDDSETKPLESKSHADSEGLLEEAIVKNPDLLEEDLTLIGRQTPTDGGPLDLLGVDAAGRLVVFELKRGQLTRDAVAQIIDYASDLESRDIDSLAIHISEQSGKHDIEKIENFEEWYGQEFDGQDLESLTPLRMCLVGLGVDAKTERMVTFMANGMDISLLTFHAFAHDGRTFLAKQVHVDAPDAPQPPPPRPSTRAEKMQKLIEEVRENGETDLFTAVRGMFNENWRTLREVPGQRGLTLKIKGDYGGKQHSPRSYARIGHRWGGGRVGLVFYPNAVGLCMDEFIRLSQKIPFGTWSPGIGQGFSALSTDYKGQGSEDLSKGDVEAQFILTPDDWKTHKDELYALTKGVYAKWEEEQRQGA